jgi:hypothetical protein
LLKPLVSIESRGHSYRKSLGFSDFTQKHSHQANICVNYYILSSNSTVKEGNKN